MKLREISAKDGRAIIIGVSILAASGFYLKGVRPFMTALSDSRERLAVARTTLARERNVIAMAPTQPALRQAADSAMLSIEPRLFTGRDDVMAGAELAAYLDVATKESRVLLQDASTRPGSVSASGVRTLRVDIRAESDLRGILALLHTLEWGDKLIRIERLDLSRLPNAADDDRTETISLNATITGFALPGGAP